MRRRSLGVMVAVMAMGCSQELEPVNCHPAPQLLTKADIEGTWSYAMMVVEERDGVWADVRTTDPVVVRTRMDEHFVVFETIADPHPAQAFRIRYHGTIEPETVEACGGTRSRETYDARPWTAHNGFVVDRYQGLVMPPSLMPGALDVSLGYVSADSNQFWPQEPLTRDAAGQALRWTMPSVYLVTTCEGMDACASNVRVLHTFTRVTAP